jgi:hypothetical protein
VRDGQFPVLSSLLSQQQQLTKSNLAQNVDPRLDIAEVKSIVEPTHLISAHLCNLGHLGELLGVAGDEVEEREAVEILGALVGDFDDLVLASRERG